MNNFRFFGGDDASVIMRRPAFLLPIPQKPPEKILDGSPAALPPTTIRPSQVVASALSATKEAGVSLHFALFSLEFNAAIDTSNVSLAAPPICARLASLVLRTPSPPARFIAKLMLKFLESAWVAKESRATLGAICDQLLPQRVIGTGGRLLGLPLMLAGQMTKVKTIRPYGTRPSLHLFAAIGASDYDFFLPSGVAGPPIVLREPLGLALLVTVLPLALLEITGGPFELSAASRTWNLGIATSTTAPLALALRIAEVVLVLCNVVALLEDHFSAVLALNFHALPCGVTFAHPL
jgi:hypothetical protein